MGRFTLGAVVCGQLDLDGRVRRVCVRRQWNGNIKWNLMVWRWNIEKTKTQTEIQQLLTTFTTIFQDFPGINQFSKTFPEPRKFEKNSRRCENPVHEAKIYTTLRWVRYIIVAITYLTNGQDHYNYSHDDQVALRYRRWFQTQQKENSSAVHGKLQVVTASEYGPLDNVDKLTRSVFL